MIIKKDVIQSQILSLKALKKNPSHFRSSTELIRATGYVNIVDMLLLPLYYTWEHWRLGSLNEVFFEDYLENSYQKFSFSTRKYIRKLIRMMKKTTADKMLSVETKSIVNSLVKTYIKIIKTL